MSRQFAFIPPQLPSLTSSPPEGDDWIHEIKHDGYRTLLVLREGAAHAYTRNGYDWTAKYWPIVQACEALPCRQAVIDGEIVVEDKRGASDFAGLSGAIAREPDRLVFHAFDLLRLNGEDLRLQGVLARRAALKG